MQIELTKEQAQVLVNLLDVATKTGGLQVAQSALFFANLVQQAASKPETPATPVTEPTCPQTSM